MKEKRNKIKRVKPKRRIIHTKFSTKEKRKCTQFYRNMPVADLPEAEWDWLLPKQRTERRERNRQMETKSILERMQYLAKEIGELHSIMDEKVVSVAKRYIGAKQKSGYGNPGDSAIYTWRVVDGVICVSWDESWNYGGYDNGGFEFPVELVRDVSALIEYEKTALEEVERKKKEAEEECEKKERLQLQKLSDKYPPN